MYVRGAVYGWRAAMVSRTHCMSTSVSAESAHWPVSTRLKPGYRCGKAVAVGSTRHAAPWKCSMMMLVIGDGTAPYASTSAWTEIYYVLEGEFTIHVGEADVTPRPVTAIAGDVVPLPGGTPHTIRNQSDVDAVAFVVHAPGPVMEGFSRAVAATATERSLGIEDVLSLAARHGIEMLGPIPA
jgi:mannose-6-phosphate isomerase-like protein (cupin superfamily)